MLINLKSIRNKIKAVVIFIMAAFLCYIGRAQVLTDTLPHNKNAVIEEFTAVHCSYCPAGHKLLDSIIDEHPERIISVAMHPANAFSNYTTPYPGSQDFRRSFLNAFFTMPFVHDSIRFFPGAFINRRQWRPNKREQFSNKWRQYAAIILNESSPVNIGISEVYDVSTGELSVDAEIYYTNTVNSLLTLYIFLNEDSLVAEQNNGGVNYIHNHVFRESFTPQWGDTIAIQANKRTLVSKHYSFSNSTANYNISNCHLSAFVRNAATEEIINGVSIKCDNIILSEEEALGNFSYRVFPNPTNGPVTVDLLGEDKHFDNYVISISDITGRVVFVNEEIPPYKPNNIDCGFLQTGIYFITVSRENKLLGTKKLIKY